MLLKAIPVLLLATTALAQTTTGSKGDAAVIENNPAGAAYVATLPNSATSDIRGSLQASSNPDGTGLTVQIILTGLPNTGGPFLYHIHDQPVSNGNCSSTLAHLDPYIRGETPTCDASQPATCQVGDLAGKHGSIPTTSFQANYVDNYISLDANNDAFVGNRSFVVHLANKTRIACANLEKYTNASAPIVLGNGIVGEGGGSASTTGTMTTTGQTTTGTSGSASSTSGAATASGTAQTQSGAALAKGVSAAAMMLAGLAMMI